MNNLMDHVIDMYVGTLDKDSSRQEHLEEAIRTSKAILFFPPSDNRSIQLEDIMVIYKMGLLKRWLEGAVSDRDEEKYNIIIVVVKEREDQCANMQSAYVDAPKFAVTEAANDRERYISDFKDNIIHLFQSNGVLRSLESDEGQGADLSDFPDENRELLHAYVAKLDQAMASVTCHFVYPLVYASLARQTTEQRNEAQRTAYQLYKDRGMREYSQAQIDEFSGLPGVMKEMESITNVDGVLRQFLSSLQRHKAHAEMLAGAKALPDKGKRTMKEKKRLMNVGQGEYYDINLEKALAMFGAKVQEEYIAYVLESVVKPLRSLLENEAHVRQLVYQQFMGRYKREGRSPIPINFFTQSMRYAGPQLLYKVFIGEDRSKSMYEGWKQLVRDIRQNLIPNMLLPAVKAQVLKTLQERFDQDSDGRFEQICNQVTRQVEEEAKRWVIWFDRCYPRKSTRSKQLTGAKEPFFSGIIKTFTNLRGQFLSYRSKDIVLEVLRENVHRFADLVAQEVFGVGRVTASVPKNAPGRRLPMDEIKDIMSKKSGTLYLEAQKAASRCFRDMIKEVESELSQDCIQDRLKVCIDLEQPLVSYLDRSKHIREAPRMPRDTGRPRACASALPAAPSKHTSPGHVDQGEPALATHCEVAPAALLASINCVAPDGRQLPPGTYVYVPLRDEHCCFRALAAVE
jgi:hypothetical protein